MLPQQGSPYSGHWAVADTDRDPLAEANLKRLSVYQESPTVPDHLWPQAVCRLPPLKLGLASGPAETNSSAQADEATPTQPDELVLGGGSSSYCAMRTLGTD